MTAKEFFGNWIVKNVLRAVALILALMIAAQMCLTCITRHNDVNSVPDFTGLTVTHAQKKARKANVRIEVTDSIFVKRMHKGIVVRQNPEAGTAVKDGRLIRLTINAMSAKQIPMPNLVGYSLRSAQAELISRGLELRKLIYVRDMATNNVLRQIYENREIRAGEMISSESEISLVLGLDDEDCVTAVPNVTGLKYRSAVDRIHENSLNVGRIIFDKGVKTYQDSLNAVVYSQNPDSSVKSIMMGRTVDIRLSLPQEDNASAE